VLVLVVLVAALGQSLLQAPLALVRLLVGTLAL
jgi:Ca2+/H+ antiporter, TMEM165/GDT1 family